MSAATTFSTVSDAREYVKDAIGATWQDFDIDAIVEEAFERTSDGWTIEDPDDDFWSIVESHDVHTMSSIRHFADIAKTAGARAYLNRLADYADAHRREVASMPAWACEVAVDVRVPVSAKVEHDGLEVETWTSRRGVEMHRVHWLDGSSTQYDRPLDKAYVAWDFGGTIESH